VKRAIPPWAILLAIGLLGFAVRLISVFGLRASDVSDLLLGDASTYDPWARAIAAGDWVGRAVFYQAPLYPYLLGMIYALAGPSLFAARLVQAAFGGATCVALALAGRSFFDRRTGVLAGALLAVYPPAIFYDGQIDKTNLTGLLLAVLLVLLGRLIERPARATAAWAGVALGLLALARENALILAPVLAAWALWFFRGREGRGLALALLLGTAAALAPVAIRNAAVGGELHLTTAQSGPNFYIGNNARADGTYVPIVPGHGDPAYERADATLLAQQALGRTLTPGQVSSYWTRRGFEFIGAHPGRWLGLLARKVALTVNAIEAMDTEDLYTYRKWSLPLRVLSPILGFGLILPLAAAGVVLTAARRRRLAVLYLLAAGYALGLIAFYVVGRYRYPLALPALLFAAAALTGARAAARRRLAIAGGALVVVAVASNWPLLPKASFTPVTESNIAYALMSQGNRREAALKHLDAALAANPGYPTAHQLEGVLLLEMGRAPEAEAHLRRAIELEPDRALTYGHLAGLLAGKGEIDEATALYRKSVALDPFDAEAQGNLAGLLATAGLCDEAIAHIERALALKPDVPQLRLNRALILGNCGRYAEAEAELRATPPGSPLFGPARRTLVTLYLQEGQPQRAVAELEAILRAQPGLIDEQLLLAWILAAHPDPSVRDGRRAVSILGGLLRALGGPDAPLLDAVAAARAETGDFGGAEEAAERAIALARRAGRPDLAGEIARRRDLYRRGEPYRRTAW
jgi:tetratricopeptide (TPR) repeat protein